MKVQREINITTLVKRIETLEARVKKLEEEASKGFGYDISSEAFERRSLWDRIFGWH